jgi:15-cis-phytoene synthase
MSAKADPTPARALARLYCPPAQAAVLDALLGIEAEIGAALKAGLEHEVAHARLAWWREECARLVAGVPVHPLTRALSARFAGAARASLEGIGGLVDLASWDLARATFASRRELTGYCERWSAALLLPLAWAALPSAAPADTLAFGAALRELELLLALSAEARAGRVRLALDELDAAAIAPAQLTAATADAPLARLIGEAHGRARRALLAANFAPEAQPALRACLVWAGLSVRYSHRAQAALPELAGAGDHQRPLDGLIAWRIARRAARGRFGAADRASVA